MNILLGFLLLSVCVAVGFKIYSSYKYKVDFLVEFLAFLDGVESNCLFYQDEILCYLQKNVVKKSGFCTLLGKFQEYLQGSDLQAIEKWSESETKINDETKKLIVNFLLNFGRVDLQTQLLAIKNMKVEAQRLLTDARIVFNKHGSVGMKLSIMTGIALFIIVI